MTDLGLASGVAGGRLGLKGPGAAHWLVAQGIVLPMRANTWAARAGTQGDDFVVARLGANEFFLEEAAPGQTLLDLARGLRAPPRGVYPVLREDCGFVLSGDAVHGLLAQVCNVDFAAVDVDAQPVIMTLMIGVSVLIVPQATASGTRRYRIWCDPTFGTYLGETLAALVMESGGTQTGVAA
jgi:sarcosine oxidase subunit gamma